MREIRMKSIDAGPTGVKLPGTVHTVSKEEAAALVKGGHAEFTSLQPEETADGRPGARRGRSPKGAEE